jgi:hypothetical protein
MFLLGLEIRGATTKIDSHLKILSLKGISLQTLKVKPIKPAELFYFLNAMF